MIAALWGLLFGLGLIVVSPALWPMPRRRRPSGRRSRMLVRTAALSVCSAVLAVTVVYVASRSPGLTVVAGLTAACAPGLIRRARRLTETRRMVLAWPDVVDRVTSSLRSGATVTGAISELSDTGIPPIATGARAFVAAVSTTADVGQSLTLLRKTWNDPTGDRLVETLRLAHDVGGAGALQAVTDVGRDIHRESLVHSEVRARQAWIRVAMWIGLAAPWVVVLVLCSRPEGREAFASPTGSFVLVAGYALTVVAYAVMQRVARPPTPVRAFES